MNDDQAAPESGKPAAPGDLAGLRRAAARQASEGEARAVAVMRGAAVKAGEFLLFVVLLAAGLWIVIFLAMVTGVWAWYERAPDGPAAVASLIMLAVPLAAAAFVHDRIMRKAGVRPPEAVAVTLRKALWGMAAASGEFLLLLALMAPWAIFWGFLFFVSGLRAKMYGADQIWVWVMTGAALILVGVPAFMTQQMILRKLRARGRPPERAVE